MLKGIEQGRYVLRFPDVLSTCICAGLGGTSELTLPVIVSAIIAPLVVSPLHSGLKIQKQPSVVAAYPHHQRSGKCSCMLISFPSHVAWMKPLLHSLMPIQSMVTGCGKIGFLALGLQRLMTAM